MENKDILVAISRDDGGVSIMSFTVVGRGSVLPGGAIWLKDGWWARDSSKEIIDSEVEKATFEGPAATGWRFIEKHELPQDRTYRNAWKDDGQKVVHDMPKAKELHRSFIRKLRVSKLRDLDGEFMRALGQGKKDEQNSIEAKRQKLRDAPADPRIESAQTVEELKLISI